MDGILSALILFYTSIRRESEPCDEKQIKRIKHTKKEKVNVCGACSSVCVCVLFEQQAELKAKIAKGKMESPIIPLTARNSTDE